MKNIITIDFDQTLSGVGSELVRDYVKGLVDTCPFEVYILTYRYDNLHYHLYDEMYTPNDNSDLYMVADKLGVTRDRVIFTNCKPKSEYINSCGRIFLHLDDSHEVIEDICVNSECYAVDVKLSNWKAKMDRWITEHFNQL